MTDRDWPRTGSLRWYLEANHGMALVDALEVTCAEWDIVKRSTSRERGLRDWKESEDDFQLRVSHIQVRYCDKCEYPCTVTYREARELARKGFLRRRCRACNALLLRMEESRRRQINESQRLSCKPTPTQEPAAGAAGAS